MARPNPGEGQGAPRAGATIAGEGLEFLGRESLEAQTKTARTVPGRWEDIGGRPLIL